MAVLTAAEVIGLAIHLEENSLLFYRMAGENESLSTDLRKRFRKIHDLKSTHLGMLRSSLQSNKLTLNDFGSEQETVHAYLKDIFNNSMLNSQDSNLRVASQLKDGLELIKIATETERDLLLYFQGIRETVSNTDTSNDMERVILENIDIVNILHDGKGKLKNEILTKGS